MIEPIKITLVEDAEKRLRRYLRDEITAINTGLREIREQKLVNWRKAYEAVPAQPTREFPFHGASNIIVPVIAIHSDTLLARVMAAVFKTQPLWTARLVGEFGKDADKWREAFEMHMAYVGIEPTELDLYRVYHEWFGETIRYGTSTVKCPVHKVVEDFAVAGPDGLGKVEYLSDVKYHGSRPEKIPFKDFGIAPDAKTVEGADFKYHCIHYKKAKLEELAYLGIYDKDAVKEVLKTPDRTSSGYVETQQQNDAGARVVPGFGFAEYDVYECHFKYKMGRRYTKCIAWYSEKTDKILRIFHQYYPDDIFITARLFYRDDFFFGYGFAETLSMLQEEVSTIHNQRRDNSTIANTRMWRVDPDSELNKGYRTYPGALMPAKKDEIEPFDSGQVNPMTIDEERLTLELAEKRSGVSAPIQGMGSGAMNKRGVYSSMGTLSLLQEGNTRTDLNITDIRYAHTKLGRVIARQEAEFFSDDVSRYKRYGKMAEDLLKGLQAYKKGLLTMPVYAATASVNREVEKQSDLMLSGMMQKHHQMILEMMQAGSNQFTPPDVKQYLTQAVESASVLMKAVFRHFGYDEVDRYVPTPAAQPSGGLSPQAPPQLPGTAPGSTPPGVEQGGGGPPQAAGGLAQLLMGGVKPQ